MKGRVISASELAELTREGTNAHRLWTLGRSWVDRYGDAYLVSRPDDGNGAELVARVYELTASLGLEVEDIFSRTLVKQPKADDIPKSQVAAPQRPVFERIVLERGLKFRVNFGVGYSVGLFCDQRANREYLESLRPRRVLNCFAYTCAFSVAASRAGAETVSLDLSRKALDWGRANFEFNGIDAAGHRFIADDVFSVMPRLARRGEKFDAIILDPPTFSRGAKGRVFRAERDFGELLEMAKDVAQRGAHILMSTNSQEMNVYALKTMVHHLRSSPGPVPPEYPPGSAAATLWVTLP